MGASLAVRGGKGGHKSVSTPGIRPEYVLGSRPTTLRAQQTRIKPGPANTTQYGKANPAGASAGRTFPVPEE